ncbi:MAG: MATE family efflux transporter [Defluviitaleaceae bacterium]|nr:MATE family efflux transporter [Defluviitaleaceae bacterium]
MQRFKKLLSSIDMTQGAPWEKLLIFTIPLLIGNLFQQLYSTADAIFLGRFVGDNALAAVGSSMPIFFLIMVLLMGVSIGAGIMVSQYFGAKSREDLSYTIGTSITIITILSLIMTIFFPLGTRPLLTLLGTPPEILDDSTMYMNILLWGVLGMAYFNILSGILRGLGDAFSPLIYLIITCLLNIALNFFFIVALGLGVFGAAIGTVIAQGFSSILCFRRLLRMQDVFDFNWHFLWPKKKYVNQVLKLGVPTGASQAVFAIGMMIVQPLVNGFGALFIAANVIVMRIDSFVMMPNFSFGNAVTVYAGQNMGAGKMDRLGQGVKQCSIMASVTALILVGIILLFSTYIAGAFTQTEEVINLSQRMLWILAPGYVIFSLNMVLWGVIRGAGDAISPMWGSLINTVVIRVPTAYLFVHLMGRPEALMYSLLAGWVTNTIIGFIVYRWGRWREKGLVMKAPASAVEESSLEEPEADNESI